MASPTTRRQDLLCGWLPRLLQRRRPCTEILSEMLERTLYRERCHAAEAAQRPLQHRLAQAFQQVHVALAVHSTQNPVDDLHAARRTDPARCALAAGLHRAELHRVAGHARHIDGIVEHDDTSMA